MAAATYTQEYNFAFAAGGSALVQRLACAVVDYAASVVFTEGSSVAGHTARMALASQAANNPDGVARQMLLGAVVVLGNAGNIAPTDADLKTTVGNLWNLYCGNA